DSTKGPDGQPFRKAKVVFAPTVAGGSGQLGPSSSRPESAAGGGHVRAIVQDTQAPKRVDDPAHPDPDGDGVGSHAHVDLATEMTDMLEASRAYEANVTVINVAKNMAQRALDIGRA